MTERNRANELRIQTPCPRTWDTLAGDDRKRFCGECNLHVHNSEALTRAEADALVAESSGRVCMRIVQDESGAPVYLDPDGAAPRGVRHSRGGGRALARVARWALAAGTGLLAACRPEAPARVETGPEAGHGSGTPEASVGIVAPRAEIGDVVYPEQDLVPPEALGEVEAVPELGKVAVEALGEVVPEEPE